MTINNWTAYKDSLWDWSILKGCFGDTKIEPTDIDGFVERNGHFLVIETKLPGVELKPGQLITFSKLVQDRRFTVLFVWGHPGNPERIELWWGTKTRAHEKASIATLKEEIRNWFEYADASHYNAIPY